MLLKRTTHSKNVALREKCPYPQYLSVFSPNAGKYGPENLQIRTLFAQWKCFYLGFREIFEVSSCYKIGIN